MNNFWKNINYNKWKQDVPDCQIRSICSAIGFDYEIACKLLGVKCIPGKGFVDSYGIDLYDMHDKLKSFLGPIKDMFYKYDDPFKSLISGQTLNSWLDEHKNDNKIYLVYLDDNKLKDGGHIVCAKCLSPSNTYFVDTWDCSKMFVQAFCEVKKVLPKTSKYHW